MLTPRLTDCVVNGSIAATLTQLDARLTYWATVEYNNLSFSTNTYIPANVIGDLLNYKRILEYRVCNPDYAMVCGLPTTAQVISKVKILINK